MSDERSTMHISLSERAGEREPGERGYIVATKKLTSEDWQEFEPGELIVFRDGEMIYSSAGGKPRTGLPGHFRACSGRSALRGKQARSM